MGAQDLSYWSMVWALALLIPVIAVTLFLQLGFVKDLLIATGRMVGQLALVGLYLEFLFKLNNTWLNIAYGLIMASIAGIAIIRSSKLSFKHFWKSVIISIIVPYSLVLLYFNSVIIQITNIFDAQYIIVVGGMILGNILGINIIVLSSFCKAAHTQNDTYISMIGMGASKTEALTPIITHTIRITFMPTIARMATIGLVSLPGMMTGQILGGSTPTIAIKYQIAIMLAILCSGFLSICLQVFLATKVAYNNYDMLHSSLYKK
ncbi:MAG: ABC transporter permease [Bacteroidales bacterium]